MRQYVMCGVLLVVFILIGCTEKKPEQQQIPQSAPPSLMQSPHGVANSVAGVQWVIPKSWSTMPPRQMRVATYMSSPAEGDEEGGECAVFFFGSGQGGDVDANIDRWVGQFKNAGKPVRSTKEVNGLNVTMVQIAGTYLAPGGPMMQSQGEKNNHRLLGAIVAAPEGSVFFKFTGPAQTVAAAESDFSAMVNTLSK